MNVGAEEKLIIPVLKFLLPTLTSAEKKAAEYLLAYPEQVVSLPLARYAELSCSNQATIMRLCQKVGVGGYAQLKVQLKKQLSQEPLADINMDVPGINGKDGSIASLVKRVFETNIKTLVETMALYSSEYDRAFAAIRSAEKIAFFAVGDAMHPCEMACFKLRKLGYTSYADSDPDLQIINASSLGPRDVAIVVSHTGRTRLAVTTAQIAHKRKAKVICITKYDKSPLLKFCDIKLYTATSDIVIGKEIAARRVAENAILEALFFGVLEYSLAENEQKLDRVSDGLRDNKLT